MSRFDEDMRRGCLETGEPLEALYGSGWWSVPEYNNQPPVVQCHVCGGHAYDLGDRIDCENCGIVERRAE